MGIQVAKHLRHHIEDLLLKYGVDVVVSGHIHSHSRTCVVADKDCVKGGDGKDDGGVLHVVTGSGGHKLSKVKHHQPHWVEYARRSWGYSRFTVRSLPCTCPPRHRAAVWLRWQAVASGRVRGHGGGTASCRCPCPYTYCC